MRYVVTLTSIPSRFAGLPRVVEALQRQVPPPDEVRVHVAERFLGAVPELRARVLGVRDVGPATKVYHALRDAALRGTVLVVCDDDVLKRPGWAARLLAGVAPQTVASFASIVHGGYGFAAHQATLAGFPDFFDEVPPELRTIDDDLLTLFCALRGVRVRKLPRGDPASLGAPLPYVGLSANQQKRAALRLRLARWAAERGAVAFDLRPEARAATWARYPRTFAAKPTAKPRTTPSTRRRS